jgi:transcriptional regulator with XRE-family HTH domain
VSTLYDLRAKLTRSRKYRESFVASLAKRIIPLQIRVLRKQRDWSQAELAKESALTQGVISRAEDPDYGNLTVNTLVKIAAGFDCVFVGRFISFSELGRWYTTLSDERTLEVPSFSEDLGFSEPSKLRASGMRLVAKRQSQTTVITGTGFDLKHSTMLFSDPYMKTDTRLKVVNG